MLQCQPDSSACDAATFDADYETGGKPASRVKMSIADSRASKGAEEHRLQNDGHCAHLEKDGIRSEQVPLPDQQGRASASMHVPCAQQMRLMLAVGRMSRRALAIRRRILGSILILRGRGVILVPPEKGRFLWPGQPRHLARTAWTCGPTARTRTARPRTCGPDSPDMPPGRPRHGHVARTAACGPGCPGRPGCVLCGKCISSL